MSSRVHAGGKHTNLTIWSRAEPVQHCPVHDLTQANVDTPHLMSLVVHACFSMANALQLHANVGHDHEQQLPHATAPQPEGEGQAQAGPSHSPSWQ